MGHLWLIDIHALGMIHPTLKEILKTREEISRAGILTALAYKGGTGLHDPAICWPLRAIDEECWDIKTGIAITAYINNVWIYDPQRPRYTTCLYHRGMWGVWHLHYQCHKNTIRR